MKKEVAKLSGKELDCWVARAEGYQLGELTGRPGSVVVGRNGVVAHVISGCSSFDCIQYGTYAPTRDWKQGGPILEREGIQVAPADPIKNVWVAGKTSGASWTAYNNPQKGKTALEAVMRCYVASKFGDYVDDGDGPPELSGGQAAEAATSITEIETDREDAWL